jgi:hypothetical protein
VSASTHNARAAMPVSDRVRSPRKVRLQVPAKTQPPKAAMWGQSHEHTAGGDITDAIIQGFTYGGPDAVLDKSTELKSQSSSMRMEAGGRPAGRATQIGAMIQKHRKFKEALQPETVVGAANGSAGMKGTQTKSSHTSGVVRSLVPLFPRISREQIWFVVRKVGGQRDKALQVLLILSGEESSNADQMFAVSSRLAQAEQGGRLGLGTRNQRGEKEKRLHTREYRAGRVEGVNGGTPSFSMVGSPNEQRQVTPGVQPGSKSLTTPPTATHGNTTASSRDMQTPAAAATRTPPFSRPSRGTPRAQQANAATLQAHEFAHQARAFAQHAKAFDAHDDYDQEIQTTTERTIRELYAPVDNGPVPGLRSAVSWGEVVSGPLGSGGL